VVFFADETGSWQIPGDWATVFPAWFTSLAATADPDDFAARVLLEVDDHVRDDRDRYFEIARNAATTAQREALAEAL
jgi:hypothetical protein